jgi:hypothetical protein
METACSSPLSGPWIEIVNDHGGLPDPACGTPATGNFMTCSPYPEENGNLFVDYQDCEYERAQLSTWHAANHTLDTFRKYLGDPTNQLPIGQCGNRIVLYVNKTLFDFECSAFAGNPTSFACPQLHFWRSGPTCSNMAYSTIVSHEMGHHFIWTFLDERSTINGQGAFGEGYSDSLAMLMYDTPIVGERVCWQTNEVVRNYSDCCPRVPYANCVATLPPMLTHCCNECSAIGGPISWCARLLGQLWWETRSNLNAYIWGPDLAAETALDYARQLFVAWTMIAPVLDIVDGDGGLIATSELTAIAMLTVDDAIIINSQGVNVNGDAMITNGTPHENAICDAFDVHGIPCGRMFVRAYAEGSRYFTLQTSAFQLDPTRQYGFRLARRPAGYPAIPICWVGYVGADGLIQQSPDTRTPVQWNGVHIHGAELEPGGSYDIYLLEGLIQPQVPPVAAVILRPLGDLTGDFVVTLDDILCILRAFGGDHSNCSLYAADVAPCAPNGLINLDDILAVLAGFGGSSGNCPVPCPN